MQIKTETHHFHIGSNTPGYMPESDVWPLDGSTEDAAGAVWDEAYRVFESELEGHSMDCKRCASPDSDAFASDCDKAPYLTSPGGTNADAKGALDIYLERPRVRA